MTQQNSPSFRTNFRAAVRALILMLGLSWAQPALAFDEDAEPRAFDARIEVQERAGQVLDRNQRRSRDFLVEQLRREVPALRVGTYRAFGTVRALNNTVGYLTDAGRNRVQLRPEVQALDYAWQQRELLGLTELDLKSVRITDQVRSRISGTQHVYFQQVHGGFPLYNAILSVNVGAEGRILSLNNGFLPDLAASVSERKATLSPGEAVKLALASVGDVRDGTPFPDTLPERVRNLEVGAAAPASPGEAEASAEQAAEARAVLEPAERAEFRSASTKLSEASKTEVAWQGISLEPIVARLVLLPIVRGEARLVWLFRIYTLDSQHNYEFTVDAVDGTVWTRFDLVASDDYEVYPVPVESPNHAAPAPPADARQLIMDPADATASPFGWHDTDGVPGAELTTMEGNNVHAYQDRDGDNMPPGAEPDCGAGIVCNFGLDLNQAPDDYTDAATTNLFYWTNIVHDVQFQYGFDPAAGNFQFNNYGQGGLAADSLQAESQDGSGTNNANMRTPEDGLRPRMQMFEWTAANPDRDSDLDGAIIVHEYGHGISNRLVGGPANATCLQNTQQPGEGLSDWWALAYTHEVGDTGADGRGMGTYVEDEPTTGGGIRRRRYSTDTSINNFKYRKIRTSSGVHRVGEVWAIIAWRAYWALVDVHGFDPDLYNATGNAGNQRMMLYVNEGLQNTGCSPTFADVRDGIIQAATVNHGGEDVCLLWESFARSGLGVNADDRGPDSKRVRNGFGVPSECCPGAGEGAIGDMCCNDDGCASGRCSGDRDDGETEAGICVCDDDGDCEPDEWCDLNGPGDGNNVCEPRSAECERCSRNRQCFPGARCRFGRCVTDASVPLGFECCRDRQCETGSCNSNGICQCRDNDDCPPGEFCFRGFLGIGQNECRPAVAECGPCTLNRQCAPGARCRFGRCATQNSAGLGDPCCRNFQCTTGSCNSNDVCQCTQDNQCPNGQYCALGFLGIGQNQCLPIRPECAPCTNNRQCGPNAECRFGRCATEDSVGLGAPCCRNYQCTTGSCNSDNVCQCTQDNQCPNGQYCALGFLGIGQNQCVPIRAECAPCTNNRQCGPNAECRFGRCATEDSIGLGAQCCRNYQCTTGSCNNNNVCQCTQDNHCGPNQYCDLGFLGIGRNQCRNFTPECGGCTNNGQCGPNAECRWFRCATEDSLGPGAQCCRDYQCINGNCRFNNTCN